MLYLISCLWSNEVICFESHSQQIEWRRTIETRNEYDKLHSIRYTPEGWLLASTYTIFLFDHSFQSLIRSWSHTRLSNVHAADWLDFGEIVVTNTGLDELLFCRLADTPDLEIHSSFDFAKWLGFAKKIEVRDRRNEPRVKAENDYVHVNCATPFKMAEDTLLACCLFHPNEVVFLNLETKHIVNTLEGVGESIHSAWILDDTLFVCSSAESKIRKLALTSGELLWEWTAPGKAWTRSAKLIDAETLVFTAEREREAPDSEFLGYAGCLNVKTGEMQWKLGLPTVGPFDIESFDPLR